MTIDAILEKDHATCSQHLRAHRDGLVASLRIHRSPRNGLARVREIALSRLEVHRRAALLIVAGGLLAQVSAAETRGQMLYEMHCVACHSVQIHWRAQRLAGDWNGLRGQVQRWQSIASLGWTDQDIQEVARHLNERYYQFPEPCSQLAKEAPMTDRSGSAAQ